MKSWQAILILVLAGMWLWSWADLSWGQERFKKQMLHPPMRGEGGNSSGGAQDLKLTPQQQEKLKRIRDSFVDRQEEIMLRIREKRLEMLKLFKDPEPDRKKIDASIDEIVRLEGARQHLMVDEFFEVRKLLTPEQARLFTRKTLRAMLRNYAPVHK